MHVVGCHHEITGRALIDQLRLVAATEKVAPVPMPSVKTLRVGAKKPFHAFGQIGLWCFHDQMEMIAHQTISVHLPAGLAASLAQGDKKLAPIFIVEKD